MRRVLDYERVCSECSELIFHASYYIVSWYMTIVIFNNSNANYFYLTSSLKNLYNDCNHLYEKINMKYYF